MNTGLNKFGWIDFSSADMNRVKNALAAISTGSQDELGISTIQRNFADKLFPGLTVAQTSLKYFLLIPAMLKKIEKDSRSEIITEAKKDNNLGRLFYLVRKKLIDLECKFCDEACDCASDKKNIIGNETANTSGDPNKRLVRFPHDIYWPGLYTFGLISAPSMRAYVAELKTRYDQADTKKYSSENIDKYWERFFPFPPDDVLHCDPENKKPLLLTEAERDFLYEKIKNANAVKGNNTLLELLIDKPANVQLQTPFPAAPPSGFLEKSFNTTEKAVSIAEVLKQSNLENAIEAARFALYMRCAFLGFNIAYFSGQRDTAPLLEQIKALKGHELIGGEFRTEFLDNIAEKSEYKINKPIVFQKLKDYFSLLNRDFTEEDIKKHMIEWEKAAKRGKAYLGKNKPANNEKWTGMAYLDYRLETALKLFGEQEGNSYEQ